MKKYQMLNNKWKEILYSASGFGPNLLMILMGAFFTDAINPAALPEGSLQISSQVIGGVSLILPAIFPILWMLAKIFDGLIDLPLASLTDNLKTKWGKRRPPIVVCFIPMVLSYAMCWISLGSNQILNTIWICCWALVFFTTYTMNLIAYYGSLVTVCSTDAQRSRVSGLKAFFDTINYCFVYALVPVLIQAFNINIDRFVFILLPMMATMLIPVFMIREGEKFEKKAIAQGYDITPLKEEEKVSFITSLKVSLSNKPFVKWVIVNCCSFFGLQMFLVSMNALILGGMGLNGGQMAILNTCAFAPVPLMLYLFNRLKAKKGIRFAYQTSLLSFAVCILSFLICNNYFMGPDMLTAKLVIGAIGGVIGSWGISAFFMTPYLIPTQIASAEEKITGRNVSAMFVAVQAVATSIVGAISSSLIYETVKMLFIAKGASGIVWAENATLAAEKFGVEVGSVFNLGVMIVPVFVSIMCAVGFFVCFLMPKNYSLKDVAKELKVSDEVMAKIIEEDKESEIEDKEESLAINIPLYVLSGTIFGLVWRWSLLSMHNPFKKHKWIHYLLSVIFFPYTAVLCFKMQKRLVEKSKKYSQLNFIDCSIPIVFLGIMGLSVVSYIILQVQTNQLLRAEYEQAVNLDC